jgi:hypothetical protein
MKKLLHWQIQMRLPRTFLPKILASFFSLHFCKSKNNWIGFTITRSQFHCSDSYWLKIEQVIKSLLSDVCNIYLTYQVRSTSDGVVCSVCSQLRRVSDWRLRRLPAVFEWRRKGKRWRHVYLRTTSSWRHVSSTLRRTGRASDVAN